MSAPVVHDYRDIVTLLSVNWKAEDDAFQYLLDNAVDRINSDLAREGIEMDAPNVAALHDAAWAYRAHLGSRGK